jgi:glycosyltransferase involved in cell wall biosynthesis
MISFEHGACKKPQIVPNHTVFPELWDQSAVFLEISEDIELANNPFLMKKSSVESVAASFNKLLSNKSLYDTLAEKAYQNAKLKDFSWDNIVHKWKILLESYREKEF